MYRRPQTHEDGGHRDALPRPPTVPPHAQTHQQQQPRRDAFSHHRPLLSQPPAGYRSPPSGLPVRPPPMMQMPTPPRFEDYSLREAQREEVPAHWMRRTSRPGRGGFAGREPEGYSQRRPPSPAYGRDFEPPPVPSAPPGRGGGGGRSATARVHSYESLRRGGGLGARRYEPPPPSRHHRDFDDQYISTGRSEVLPRDQVVRTNHRSGYEPLDRYRQQHHQPPSSSSAAAVLPPQPPSMTRRGSGRDGRRPLVPVTMNSVLQEPATSGGYQTSSSSTITANINNNRRPAPSHRGGRRSFRRPTGGLTDERRLPTRNATNIRTFFIINAPCETPESKRRVGICDFNPMHVYDEDEIDEHMKECPDNDEHIYQFDDIDELSDHEESYLG